MNDATLRGWGAAVKACATLLALSILALLTQMGHLVWQRTQSTPHDRIDLQAVHAIQRLPADARHLARLGREALSSAAEEDAFASARARVAADIQQVIVQQAMTPDAQGQAQALISAWADMDTAARQLSERFDLLQEASQHEARLLADAPNFKAKLDALAREMVSIGSASSQVYLALHQLVLLDDMLGRVDSIRIGGERAALDAAELPQEIAAFTRVLTGLQRGDTRIALRRLQGRRARATLAEVQAQWESLRPQLEEIAQQTPARLAAQSAVLVLERGADTLLTSTHLLSQGAGPARPPVLPGPVWWGPVAGALALLSGAGLWQALVRRRHAWNEYNAQMRHREQDEFAWLLDEMGALAEGDLSVKVAFSEDAPGALADAINFISQQLGTRIEGITNAIAPIPGYAEDARRVAIQLSEVCQYQQQELEAAQTRMQQLSTHVAALTQLLISAGHGQQPAQETARACADASADLAAMLHTLHAVTTQLVHEAAGAVTVLDTLAQSTAILRESADGFILPR